MSTLTLAVNPLGPSPSPSDRLKALYHEDWLWEINDNPEFMSQAGCSVTDPDWRPEMALQHVDPASYQRRAEHSRLMVERATEIMSGTPNIEELLTKEDIIIATLFTSQHNDIKDMIELCPLYLIPINSIGAGGICFSFLESIEWLNIDGKSEMDVLIARVKACPQQLDEFIESMREGIRRVSTIGLSM